MFERGTSRVAKVLEKFTSLTEELDKGVAEIEAEKAAVKANIAVKHQEIVSLRDHETSLDGVRVQALNLKRNISGLLGETE